MHLPSEQRLIKGAVKISWPAWLGLLSLAALLRRRNDEERRSLTAYCVYRERNVKRVSKVVSGLPPNSAVHLHCLDGPGHGRLGPYTSSSGAGMRVPILQRLIDEHPPRPNDWILIFDDDVVFLRNGARRFPEVALRAGLDLCQPGHAPGSVITFPMTSARFAAVARLTNFVEVGPVVLISPAAALQLLPFPSDVQMGWGLDIEWSQFKRRGLQLGVVDATPIRHLGSVGAMYNMQDERRILRLYLDRAGATSSYELAHDTGEVWRPWKKEPPWKVG